MINNNESESENANLQYMAKVIVDLYGNKRVIDYIPNICKKKFAADIDNMFIIDEYSNIYGIESIKSILKKAIHSNVPNRVDKTQNGIDIDNLKKGINLLTNHIDNLSANNQNEKFDEEIEKRKKELSIFEQKYKECLAKGNFEIITNYKSVALSVLKILEIASSDLMSRKNNNIRNLTKTEKNAEELRNLVATKLGRSVDNNEKKQYQNQNQNQNQYQNQNQNQYQNQYQNQNRFPRNRVEFYKSFVNNDTKKHQLYVPSYLKEPVNNVIVTENNKFVKLSDTVEVIQKPVNNIWNKPLDLSKKIDKKQEAPKIHYEIATQNIKKKNDSEDEWMTLLNDD